MTAMKVHYGVHYDRYYQSWVLSANWISAGGGWDGRVLADYPTKREALGAAAVLRQRQKALA